MSVPADAQSGQSALGRPAKGESKIVPLRADLQISRTTATSGGQRQTELETQHLYRDSQGRTRTEAGSTVTINDPTSKTTLVLDVATRTFRRSAQDQANPAPAGGSAQRDVATNQNLASPPKLLGTTEISGVRAEGREYTVNLPAHGKLPARQKDVTLWLSIDLQLPVQTRVVETSGDVNTQTYTNISAGVEPAADLFRVPAGYQGASRAAPSGNGIQANCPIRNDDPVVMTSFGYVYLDQRYVNADTDLLSGCVFVADGGVFEYPLNGYPTTDLLLWYDQWLAYDCYCPLPYLPYVAFGDIAFVAANPFEPDVTTKDSFIALTIFPA
ncbi:MAG TPA: hypothetical protein VGR06_36640 [Actinophytocola sp.]|jgi:hypothetical protein|uniref:hypothetical protein n=1 Tax=Actinophytocola sp. TaxID=1872138 RepID=UPI002E02BD04|nr:hypothetical protein [Actinophytocola sp.]